MGRSRHSARVKSARKDQAPVLAAGGIVLRDASLVAVVRLRKNKAWVLPKGKLKSGEATLAAAKREVREETGHDVAVYEYLGEMAGEPGSKPKTVQFWRMAAEGKSTRKLMRDVNAVKWLPLDQAIEKLTHAHERAFLRQVGPVALQSAKQGGVRTAGESGTSFAARIRAWLRRLTRRRLPAL
jgi:8-oxo-dGTP diphosphatase